MLVLPFGIIDQFQRPTSRFGQLHRDHVGIRRVAAGFERQHIPRFINQFRSLDSFVEMTDPSQAAALDGCHAARVLDAFLFHLRVFGEGQQRVRSQQLGILEHGDSVFSTELSGVRDPVGQVFDYLRQMRSENRILQRTLHGHTLLFPVPLPVPRLACTAGPTAINRNNKRDVARHAARKSSRYDQSRAFFDLRIAGRDFDLEGV